MKTIENHRYFNIMDTTFRDGLQSPEPPEHGIFFVPIPERQEIFTALVEYGVRYFEVFSPRVNSLEKDSLQVVLESRNKLAKTHGDIFVLAHVRCDEIDVRDSIEAGVNGLNMYMGTSEVSQKYNHGKDLGEVARRARNLLENIHRNYPHLQLRFSGEDAFRTPMSDLYTVYDGISDTVHRLGTPDTVGDATPEIVYQRVKLLKDRYPKVGLEGHFHNDLGISLYNAVTGILAGMDWMDTTIIGLAERSGITSITALLFYLYTKYPMNPEYTAGFNLEESYPLNVLFANKMNMQVPSTEPVSLTNNTDSAGVHTAARIRNPKTYRAHDLEKFGVNSKYIIGTLSGWNIVHYHLTNVGNYEGVTDEIAKEITRRLKEKCSRNSSNQNPMDILEQIIGDFGLKKKIKPATHIEDLSG